MKLNDVMKLKPNDIILHKRYGKSVVREVILSFSELFGVIITPVTDNGKQILALDSQTDITEFIEDSIRNLRISQEESEK